MSKNWELRHSVVLLFLTLSIFLNIFIGLRFNVNSSNIITVVLCTSLYAMLATSSKVTLNLRQGLAVLGLCTASSGLIFLSEGLLISHVSFAFTLILSSLYQEKITYIATILYLFFYYIIFAQINPLISFNSSEVGSNTLLWSILMLVFSLILSIPSLLNSYLMNLTNSSETKMKILLSSSALRDRQAVEIHDNIVQNLVIAKYNLDDGNIEETSRQIEHALENAKIIVDQLMTSGNVTTTRDTSSSDKRKND